MQKGKGVLITGGSRGIGAAAARLFAAAGYDVAIGYRQNRAAAHALAEELRAGGAWARCYGADVSDPRAVEDMVRQVLEDVCQLDTLVCCAGVAWQGLLTDMSDGAWREVLGVDLDGVFYCCRAVIPHFVHRKAGKIITVSSMWGQTGASCEAAYSAAKAGVIGLTRALAKELGPSGITVNCVAPGVIDTEMNARLGRGDLEALCRDTPLERIGTPRDAAESILFLASPAADFITGQVLSPNGGLVI